MQLLWKQPNQKDETIESNTDQESRENKNKTIRKDEPCNLCGNGKSEKDETIESVKMLETWKNKKTK